MKNQLQVFENKEFGNIRVVEIDGQPWFVGKEIASILGYEKERNALARHVDTEDALKWGLPTNGGKQDITIINESGLYSLILSSKLPNAKAFKRWVTSEVLPSIRKHGAYITDATLARLSEDSAFCDELIEKLLDERAKKSALLDYVERIAPKARYCDIILQCTNAVQTSIIAKDYGMSCVAFNRLLHGLGVQFKVGKTWLLYKELQNNHYTVSHTYYVDGRIASVHTLWTQKGRFFIYGLLKSHGILPEAEKNAVN